MAIYKNLLELIGSTPLVALQRLPQAYGAKGNIIAKVEYFNPSGSVKDRAALYMLKDALKRGVINKDTLIIEPTSGNTGIGLALASAVLGLKLVLTLPETMSIERRKILKAFGADLVLTEGAQGMKGAIAKAKELAASRDNTFIPSQFDNEANVQAHYETTGPEIWKDSDGKVDILVAGIGTGGTITGTGKFLKEKNPQLKVIAVEPESSPVLSAGHGGPHKIQGIGPGFVPSILDTKIYDEIITISNEDAFSLAREAALQEGLFVGISSGAALKAALTVAARPENTGKNIVVVLPDSGDRYLSTEVFKA